MKNKIIQNVRGILIILVVLIYCINITDNININFVLEKIGDYSFVIYFIHMLFKKLGYFSMEFIQDVPIIYYFLKCFITLSICCICIYTKKRVFKNKVSDYFAF